MRVWVASFIFYVCVFLKCEILRFIVSRFVKPKNLYFAELLNEFIGTVQICAPMFDVNFVLENYGLKGVLVEIIFIEIINALILRDAIADPCPLIFGFMKGVESGVRVITILAVQFSAGYFSYIIARKFWSLGMHPFHLEALEEECSADLTVTVIYGSLVEAGGCLAAKTAEVFLEEKIINEKHIIAIQAVVSGIITILGIHLTGMYANPIVAWACTFNCGQVPYLAHFFVYWMAPLLAWHIADGLYGKTNEEAVVKKKE
uniref:Aquaporin n=1 Tax=Panagrolaimus sp. PS1159 TaxID=55785 RepID=A0AC35FTJ9_9BILA